ncbi:hypothetical protein AWB91_18745 [Mycobacterium paraense]|uniref:Uncharacterized protein n=1 Tax=Mycobacterium paraense TaxID=767916 RepID=A0ABX3VKL4_9MYCO|nr:hypothetical protein AWB91_18745 [Mycobacterium paraense]ORW38623.1 hypothetical protein AWB88_18925 [Mycobacterium paraense]
MEYNRQQAGEIWVHVVPRTSVDRGAVVNVASLSRNLHEFAVELRQLAYTMPGGHEDPLIHLSERMLGFASQLGAEQSRSPMGRAAES